VKSIFVSLHSFTLFAPGQKAARLDAPWGSAARVTVTQPVNALGWPGLVVTLTVRPPTVDGPVPNGATIGTLRTGGGGSSEGVELRTATALSGPGVWWRLTR